MHSASKIVIASTIAAANKKYEKEYGGPLLIKGSDLKSQVISRATTGSLSIDLALGGGWPLNVWNEIVGQNSHGKTALVMKTIAANQALNPDYEVLWVASEDFVPQWAEQLGMDLERVTLVNTNVSEHALQIILEAQEARAVDAIVIDSLPALSPLEEGEKDMDGNSMAVGARLNNKFFRKTGTNGARSLVAEDRDCLLLAINQWRDKVGVLHGDPRITPGGKGKDYAFFTRVEISKADWIKVSNSPVGFEMKAKVFKNKTAAPMKVASVDFYFESYGGFSPGDFDAMKEIFNIAQAYDIIEQGGGYYKFLGERIEEERGKDAAYERVRWDLDLQDKIKAEVYRVVLHKEIP